MKSLPLVFAAITASASTSPAALLVQELFDDISTANATLDGAGGTSTSIGLTGNWATSVSTGIFTANNFNVNGATLPGLPASDTANGGVWNNTASWDTGIHATRPLATPIDFATDRVIYFSVRLNNPGDTAMGIGLASGSAPASGFVGAGFSWNNAVPLGSTSNIAGNSAYISHGVLDGLVDGGVYGIRAYEGKDTVNGYGLLVGRITISSTGPDAIHIKRYGENSTIDNDLNAIVWSSSATVDSSMLASHLVLWMNGRNSGELDAIRIGETWTDVTGVALAGAGQPALSGASVGGISGTGAETRVNLFTSPADVTLFWDTIDQGTGPWGHAQPLGSRSPGMISATLSGLTPDTTYYYRFHAVNTDAEPDLEAWSEAGRSFSTAPTGAVITDLDAIPWTTYEVDLFWTDIYATETGFIIERSPTGTDQWTTVATVPAGTTFHTDRHSGLLANTTYHYRVSATNAAGNSAPSNVSTTTTLPAAEFETKLLVNFNGTLDETGYALGAGEIDETGSFRANGAPEVAGGVARLNPGNELGPDGFDIDPSTLGNLTAQNWVAEAVVTYQSGSDITTPVLIDVQGDTNLRLRSATDPNVLQMFYWNGSSTQQRFTALPPNGTKVHVALAWDAGSATLTGYVNGVPFGSAAGGSFMTPDASTLSFGYFGRTGFEGRGIDGTLDAVAFQTGTAAFDPADGFLILPETGSFSTWIAEFPVGTRTGFGDDADGDGLLNGLEALLGTRPDSPNGAGVKVTASNGTATTFTHPIANPPLADVAGSYQWSADLVNWHAGDGVAGPSGGPTVVISPAVVSGSTATVTATSSAPVKSLFFRVTARQVP